MVHNARDCALAVLAQDRPPSHEVQSISGTKLVQFCRAAGMVASVAFAPPWDGETRMFAARLPLFFLLPACEVGGLYLLTVSRFLQKAFEADVTSHQEIAIGEAGILGGTLFLATLLAIGVS